MPAVSAGRRRRTIPAGVTAHPDVGDRIRARLQGRAATLPCQQGPGRGGDVAGKLSYWL